MKLIVANRTILNPFQSLENYFIQHARTVWEYDLCHAGAPSSLSMEDLQWRPIIHSRIGAAEAEMFVEVGRAAPWSSLKPSWKLVEARLETRMGRVRLLSAHSLYRYFSDNRSAIGRVSFSKIHKVLHFKRPAFVPILDSRLWKAYRPQARAIARDSSFDELVAGWNSLARWVAIHQDLVTATPRLEELRDALRKSPRLMGAGFSPTDVDRISDLRLLDMVTWQSF